MPSDARTAKAGRADGRAARPTAVHLVGSAGGHLGLLEALLGALDGRRRRWFTARSPRAEALELAGERVGWLPSWDRKTVRLSDVLAGARIAIRERPALVVTTGAGMAVPFCLAARALGSRLIFVETQARIASPSLAGRVLSRISDRVFVQWPEMQVVYRRATLCRPMLLESLPRSFSNGGEGTLVSVGTHTAPFDRLLRMVDAAVEAGALPRPVLAQTGHCQYEPRTFEPRAWLSSEEMAEAVRTHRYVVCHAGDATVVESVRAGRRPIVVARRSSYGEHVDDHQLLAAARLSEIGLAVSVADCIRLEDVRATERALEPPALFAGVPALADELRGAVRALSERPSSRWARFVRRLWPEPEPA